MRASLLFIFALVVLALAKPLTREKVQCAQRAFDRHYTSQHPYSNYISYTAVQEDNGEYVIFVGLWQEPPASLSLPQSYRGAKVIYHLEPVMCTMEAKMCPDGSYVGRTGPKCEFAPCPNELQNNSTSSSHHPFGRMRMSVFVLSFTIFSAVCFSLCLCCCAAIARRRKCRMANDECDLESLESLAEHVETQQPEQATVVPQAQPQPIYYYAPYPQAPAVNQAPYGAFPYMMPMQAPMAPQPVFQPMSDEEYARQLQAQFNNEH